MPQVNGKVNIRFTINHKWFVLVWRSWVICCSWKIVLLGAFFLIFYSVPSQLLIFCTRFRVDCLYFTQHSVHISYRIPWQLLICYKGFGQCRLFIFYAWFCTYWLFFTQIPISISDSLQRVPCRLLIFYTGFRLDCFDFTQDFVYINFIWQRVPCKLLRF